MAAGAEWFLAERFFFRVSAYILGESRLAGRAFISFVIRIGNGISTDMIAIFTNVYVSDVTDA